MDKTSETEKRIAEMEAQQRLVAAYCQAVAFTVSVQTWSVIAPQPKE